MKTVRFFRWSVAGLTLAACVATLPFTAAAVNVNQTAKKTEHKAKATWQISTVDASAGTVALSKSDLSSNLTVRITAATRITVNGKAAKLADLKDDMKVSSVSVSGTACSQLAATSATTDAKKKK